MEVHLDVPDVPASSTYGAQMKFLRRVLGFRAPRARLVPQSICPLLAYASVLAAPGFSTT